MRLEELELYFCRSIYEVNAAIGQANGQMLLGSKNAQTERRLRTANSELILLACAFVPARHKFVSGSGIDELSILAQRVDWALMTCNLEVFGIKRERLILVHRRCPDRRRR